jgi:hypothetical protein
MYYLCYIILFESDIIMNRDSRKVIYLIKLLISVFLIASLFLQYNCSSSYHAGKGKKGMVPCPCEKRHNRK